MSSGERALRLRLHGEAVAIVVERGARPRHHYELVFEPSWAEQLQRPVLSLGALNWRLPIARAFPGLPPFLTNLLPERGGAMRRRIARAANLDEHDDLAFLRFVGHDMSGAITVEDADAPAPSARVIEEGSEYPAEAMRLRASFGGIQPKFSVDRTDAYEPVHMEEVASALGMHPEEKYAEPNSSHPEYHLGHVGRLIRRFAGERGLDTFLRRIVFDVLVGNSDAHLKNWAFLFPDRRAARLAPAYDIVPTMLYGYGSALALRFAGGQTFHSIDMKRVRLFAQGRRFARGLRASDTGGGRGRGVDLRGGDDDDGPAGADARSLARPLAGAPDRARRAVGAGGGVCSHPP